MTENMGVEVGNRGAIPHRLKAISTSGLVVSILNSCNQSALDNVCSVRDVPGMVAKWGRGILWNRVANSMRSIVIFTSGLRGRHFEFGSPPTSGNVDSVTSMSILVENVGIAELKSRPLSHVVQNFIAASALTAAILGIQ